MLLDEFEYVVFGDENFYIMYMFGMMGLFKGVVYIYNMVFWVVVIMVVIIDFY